MGYNLRARNVSNHPHDHRRNVCFPEIVGHMVVLKRGFVTTCVFHLYCIEDSYLYKKWNDDRFQSMPKCPFSPPPAVPRVPLLVKIQNHQITSKLMPLERSRKTKHFSYMDLDLEMSRSKVLSTWIWSRDPTLWKLPKVKGFWYTWRLNSL